MLDVRVFVLAHKHYREPRLSTAPTYIRCYHCTYSPGMQSSRLRSYALSAYALRRTPAHIARVETSLPHRMQLAHPR